MTSYLSPQVILLVYWLLIVVIAAFCMRMACSLCQVGQPTWRRAIISVVVVTFLAYVTADFSAYLLMRSMQDVVIQVPPGYGYTHWFREALGFKWMVISHAGPLRYLPIVFAVCVAGILQVIVLQAEVTFRWGLVILILQYGATAVAGYLLFLAFGAGLDAIGWTPPPVEVPPSSQAQGSQGAKDAGPAGAKFGKGPAKAGGKMPAGSAFQKGPDVKQPAGMPASLQTPGADASGETMANVKDALQNLKKYADSHLEEVKEELAPLTKYLPQPVHDFLDAGGWYLVFGVLFLIALLWLRSIVNKLRGAFKAKRKKRKKPRTKEIAINLKVKLAKIGEAITDEGPERIIVNGIPARLRLIILSVGSRNSGALHEDMADRVLDWIKPGLAHASTPDYPTVRVWPAYLSADGFSYAVRANVIFPDPEGERSPWGVLIGQVKMGTAIIHVALGFYADQPHTSRTIRITGNQWLNVLNIKESGEPALARK
jgi:hypothetical protein